MGTQINLLFMIMNLKFYCIIGMKEGSGKWLHVKKENKAYIIVVRCEVEHYAYGSISLK